MHDALNKKKKKKIFWFFTGRAFYEIQFLKNRISDKWPQILENRLKINVGQKHTSFMGFYCKSISHGLYTVHSATKQS